MLKAKRRELRDESDVELVLADGGDALDAEDRARLHASIERSGEQFDAGLGIDAEQALVLLRA